MISVGGSAYAFNLTTFASLVSLKLETSNPLYEFAALSYNCTTVLWTTTNILGSAVKFSFSGLFCFKTYIKVGLLTVKKKISIIAKVADFT